MKNYIDGFKNYFNFRGRATRPQFFGFVIINIGAMFLLASLASLLDFANVLFQFYVWLTIIPILSITSRRMRDAGYSAWLTLLYIIGIGAIVLLVLALQKSELKNE